MGDGTTVATISLSTIAGEYITALYQHEWRGLLIVTSVDCGSDTARTRPRVVRTASGQVYVYIAVVQLRVRQYRDYHKGESCSSCW